MPFDMEIQGDLKRYFNEKFRQHKLIYTKHKWVVRLSETQVNMLSGTWTDVEFDFVMYDCANIGITNYRYVVQEKGFHLCMTNIRWAGVVAAASYYLAFFRSDGTYFYPKLVYKADANPFSLSNVGIIPADIGHSIGVRVLNTSGANTVDVYGGQSGYSKFGVHLLSRRCY